MKIVSTEIYLRKLKQANPRINEPCNKLEERGRHATTTKAEGAKAPVDGPESCSRPHSPSDYTLKPELLGIDKCSLLTKLAGPEPETTCQHDFMFDSFRSFENGAGEIYVCRNCGGFRGEEE